VQKEYFDSIEVATGQRIKPDVRETGFVDGLDRRYPVPKKELKELINESLSLPTTWAVYIRKEHPEDRVAAFQVVNPAMLITRSRKE
jgi:hypothetical protein